VIAVVTAVVGLLAGGALVLAAERWRRRRALARQAPVRRIAFAFTGEALSEPALVSALRVARAEGAVLMPVYLALVPRALPLDSPLPRECAVALALLEAVEQRAMRAEVPVDSRIERGRTVRHALSELIAHEQFGRLVVPAGPEGSGEGLAPADVAWLLDNAPSEVAVLRPGQGGMPDLHPVASAAVRRAWRRRQRGRTRGYSRR
jgi:hypothetical protein